jgi:hypothetical protein
VERKGALEWTSVSFSFLFFSLIKLSARLYKNWVSLGVLFVGRLRKKAPCSSADCNWKNKCIGRLSLLTNLIEEKKKTKILLGLE